MIKGEDGNVKNFYLPRNIPENILAAVSEWREEIYVMNLFPSHLQCDSVKCSKIAHTHTRKVKLSLASVEGAFAALM